ncbi:MAG TPA: hypothetical protein VHF26_09915, partial [Trebonia sp.]|nr:hypothetical protein [Trebonia sp.]
MKRAALVAVAVAAMAAAGCGSGAGGGNSSSGGAATGRAVAPALATSVSTAAASWGILVMGGSAASEDNFWQLFTRPAGAAAWKLVTPPGVADNGGLVMASDGRGPLVVGIRPSQSLVFSPLATTSDDGRTWTPGLVDAGLADTADSLAVASGRGQQFALLSSGAIERAPSAAAAQNGSGWSKLAAPGSIAASAPGRSCGLSSVAAITVAPSGELLAGGACDHPGTAGIFGYSGGAWHAAGPVLPGAVAGDRVQVLRLTATSAGNVALLLAGPDLFAAWTSDGGARWTVSPPLAAAAADVSSAAFGSGGAVGVLLSSGKAATAAGPGSSWRSLPAVPPDTAV